MNSVQYCPLPADSLLLKYAAVGTFTDCYVTEVGKLYSQAEYVEAFYRGAAIRLERFFIGWALSRPSTDEDVRLLATGGTASFSAWQVEERHANQLLLCDVSGRTRSWLMSTPSLNGTLLYFGSAVLPIVDRTTGQQRMGPFFGPLIGFHRAYSKHLLSSVRLRLARSLSHTDAVT